MKVSSPPIVGALLAAVVLIPTFRSAPLPTPRPEPSSSLAATACSDGCSADSDWTVTVGTLPAGVEITREPEYGWEAGVCEETEGPGCNQARPCRFRGSGLTWSIKYDPNLVQIALQSSAHQTPTGTNVQSLTQPPPSPGMAELLIGLKLDDGQSSVDVNCRGVTYKMVAKIRGRNGVATVEFTFECTNCPSEG